MAVFSSLVSHAASFGVLATTGVVLGAAYMLWMVQKVFFGQVTHQENLGLADMNKRELAAALPFIVLIAVMGLRPQPFLDVLNTSTERFVARAKYASGDSNADDRLVRVLVRQLPKPAVAQADAPPPMRPNLTPDGLVRPARAMMKPLQPIQPVLQPSDAQVLP